ncbi:MAG: hypothetical protein Q8Q92_03050 [bacterium]|nr:hypothetical protein [bacterium]
MKKLSNGMNWNTHKEFIYPVRESSTSNGTSCKCKKIWVDSCEFTPLDNFISNGEIVRVGGNEGDYKVIHK